MKISDKVLQLVLCDPQDHSKELSLNFRIFDIRVAHLWADILGFLHHRGAAVRTPDRFYNFEGDPKGDPNWIKQELNACVDAINRLYPGYIDYEMPVEINQTAMNKLHEYFVDGCYELGISKQLTFLQKGVYLSDLESKVQHQDHWHSFLNQFSLHTQKNAKDLNLLECIDLLNFHPQCGAILGEFYSAFDPAKPYLHRLNEAIHRWEDRCAVLAAMNRGAEGWRYFVANFDPTCWLPLEDEDYQYFTIQNKFGRVYLDDLFPGKCIWDVYRDKDEIIVGEHYKNLDYFWGDCSFYMGPSHSDEMTQKNMDGFWAWFDSKRDFLASIGFYRDNPKMTIGRLPVADLDLTGDLQGMQRAEINKLVSQHQYIKSLNVYYDGGEEVHPQSTIKETWTQLLSKNWDYAGKIFV